MPWPIVLVWKRMASDTSPLLHFLVLWDSIHHLPGDSWCIRSLCHSWEDHKRMLHLWVPLQASQVLREVYVGIYQCLALHSVLDSAVAIYCASGMHCRCAFWSDFDSTDDALRSLLLN